MSLWVGNTEVGLSPGQTSGEVGGKTVYRDPSSDISKPYIEATDIQTVTVPTGGYKVTAGGKTYYTNTPPEIGYYKPEMGFTSVRRTDMLTPEQVEEQYRQQVASGQIIPNIAAYRAEAKKLEAARKSLVEQGYKPYVTIEGTTLYTKGTQKKEITVPKYGKFVQRGERIEPFLGVFTPDAFIDQIDNTQNKISLQVEKLNNEISEKYGLKETVEEATKFYRHAQFLEEYDPKYKGIGKASKSELGKAMTEYAIGFTEEAANKPVTAAGNALFALLVTKGVGGAAAKAPILTQGIGTGKIVSKVNAVNILGTSLAGLYGIDVTQRAIAAENKARFAGQITSTEILPFAAGGYVGTRKFPSISTKEITRRAEINYLKAVREGRIIQAKTEREFDIFIRDESAELLQRRRRRGAETILKPEVAKKAEEVEVIRADIALEQQLNAEERIKQISISNPKTRHEFKQLTKTMQVAKTKQLPILLTLNIQKAEAIIHPEVKSIATQKSIAIQEPIAIQKYKPIQKAIAIQEERTVQIAEAIMQAKTKQNNIQKTKELLKHKPKLELPIKKVIPTKTAKNFIEAVDERYKRKKKTKWVWDVNNPVPTLEEVIS